VPHDRPGPDADRLIVARLTGVAWRHARWGALDEDQAAAGAAELREIADDCGDLLAEVAGLALGTAEARGERYTAKGQAVAGLCRLAGADETAIAGWAEEGRRRVAIRSKPPFSDPPPRTPPRP